MKTLIISSVLILASGSSLAYDARFDAQEYYAGQDTDHQIVINPEVTRNSDNLFLEGNFPRATPETGTTHENGIVDIDIPTDLYLEGNWDV